MGGENSKRVSDNSHQRHEEASEEHNAAKVNGITTECDDITILDQQYIQTIKNDLKETPELFVLNNMLMSIMFFENYQKEIQEVSFKRYEKGETCITPDVVLEKVNKNVLYRPLHGPKKYYAEPLIAKRLYVLNDSVKVLGFLDLNINNHDKSVVQLEESPRKGFVKLREVETSSAAPADEEIPISRTEATPSTSRSSTDSDTTDYAILTDIRTPKPIEIIKGLEKQDTQLNLPGSCIAYRKVRKLFSDLELDDPEIDDIKETDLFDIVSYISSKGFMKYFQNIVFPTSVGLNLGFSSVELSMAKSIPGKIFCSLTEDNVTIPCEVLPSLSIRWPRKQTVEFLMKGHKPPEARKRYIFPTEGMVKEMTALNCVLVPKGYLKKKGQYLDGDIEWEIHFPQAERYLETFMSHAQAKSFLFLLTLHKTYIEPKTRQLGLLIEHIRHFLLWECESNYSEWPEHRLGTKLVNVINKFNSSIAKRRLPDYFVAEKNIFDNVPKKYLADAQRAFHDVLESPVMSFIKSLRNLRYTKGSFYPPFDFDRLYEILIKTGIESTNPQLVSDLLIPPNYRRKRYYDSDTQLKHVLEVKRREREIQKRQTQAEKENLDNSEERRESTDSINMDWTCEKEFDIYKKRALLTFFIKNFMDIAEKCAQISSHKQTLLYLKQAKYLTIIMGDECLAVGEEVDEFLNKIRNREVQCNRKAATNGENVAGNQETSVKFATSVSNKLSSPNTSENVLKINGMRPRKSVAFAQSRE